MIPSEDGVGVIKQHVPKSTAREVATLIGINWINEVAQRLLCRVDVHVASAVHNRNEVGDIRIQAKGIIAERIIFRTAEASEHVVLDNLLALPATITHDLVVRSGGESGIVRLTIAIPHRTANEQAVMIGTSLEAEAPILRAIGTDTLAEDVAILDDNFVCGVVVWTHTVYRKSIVIVDKSHVR